MSAITLQKKIAQLPENLRMKAEKMIDDLLAEATNPQQANFIKENSNRGYGSLKGKIWMSDDFNEPLDDFVDYM